MILLLDARSFDRTIVGWKISDGGEGNVHTRSAARDFPSLRHTLKLAPTVRLRLADHIVVIVWSASITYEVGCAEERSGSCADFWDLRYVIWHRSGVNENMSVEPRNRELGRFRGHAILVLKLT